MVLRDLFGNDFEGGMGQFGGPFNDLFIWAILMARQRLAIFFWERTKHPLKMALMAVLLYRKMATSRGCLGRDDLKELFEEHALEFENKALELQTVAIKDDPLLTLYALERCVRGAYSAASRIDLRTNNRNHSCTQAKHMWHIRAQKCACLGDRFYSTRSTTSH
jgi:hypothetical protein